MAARSKLGVGTFFNGPEDVRVAVGRTERGSVIPSVDRLFRDGPVSGLDDRQLLNRFLNSRDEAAFNALVAKHGPPVLGVCQRIARDTHDVEDAFQATFLILVRKAGSIRDADRLGPWLFGVARRVALRVRSNSARRKAREQTGPEAIEELAMPHASHRDLDLLAAIDEEVARLPARFRDAVILCDLENVSYLEAARRLRCPVGTVQSRLSRGRARLRDRLARRGLGPASAVLAIPGVAPPVVPETLAKSAAQAALALASTGSVASTAGTLATEVIRSSLVSKSLAFSALSTTIVSAAIGVSFLAQAAPPPVPAPKPELAQKGRTLDLDVISADDKTPLKGASVWVRVTTGNPREMTSETGTNGHNSIALPAENLTFLHIVVAHPGYVPIELRWDGAGVPEAYTLALARGDEIGGTVVDDKGQPVVGAKVLAQPSMTPPGGPPQMYVSQGDIGAATTDAQGDWRSHALPESAGPRDTVGLTVTHPDFVTLNEQISAEAARAVNGMQVIKPGVAVAGTVLDPDGKPVAGQTISVTQSLSRGPRTVKVKTDAQGKFLTAKFADPAWHEVIAVVQAPGFASVGQGIVPSPSSPPVVIQLARPRPMFGRVVDSKGNPVAGVVITSSVYPASFDWQAKTGADGQFAWAEAPAVGPVVITARHPAFTDALWRQVDPSAGEVALTLHRTLRLHGTVTDAATGKPIEQFTLTPGWGPQHDGERVEWLRSKPSVRSFGAGAFDVSELFPDQGRRRSIRIEAEGYLPAEWLGFRDDSEDLTHDFALKKAASLSGIVRDSNGNPLAGATVALSGSDNFVRIANGRITGNLTVGEATQATTGPDGRYTFLPQAQRVSIAVTHDAGYAFRTAAELDASADVTVASWGRIEGVMRVGTKPAAHQKVAAWLNGRAFTGRLDYDTMTDANGRFAFDRVTPGNVTVYRFVDNDDHHGWTPSNPVTVDVAPDATVRVEVGGTGRPIVGRLVPPAGSVVAEFVLAQGHLATPRPKEPTPDDFDDFTDEARTAWHTAFWKTPEGQAHLKNHQKMYHVALRPDGTFRIEDVPPGDYLLELPFESRTLLGQQQPDRLGMVNLDVVVPETASGRSDEPLDLGAVPLEVFSFRPLKVGDLTPEFVKGAADGRSLDLKALRGKFVLLSFWASYNSYTRRDLPMLKATFDTFSGDPRFTMIGLSQDMTHDLAKRYAKRHGLAWDQHYVGISDLPNAVPSAFGVRYSPSTLLIDPDGRVLARDLAGAAIKDAVAKALAKE